MLAILPDIGRGSPLGSLFSLQRMISQVVVALFLLAGITFVYVMAIRQ
jgi:hypothetical protein